MRETAKVGSHFNPEIGEHDRSCEFDEDDEDYCNCEDSVEDVVESSQALAAAPTLWLVLPVVWRLFSAGVCSLGLLILLTVEEVYRWY